MSAFADDCREKAARYAERATAYRMAGDSELAEVARNIAIGLAGASSRINQLARMEADAAERMQS